MLARSGLIGCPCPVPVSLTSSLPSSMTPTLIHFPISRSTLPSLTRFSIISTRADLTIESKYERMSISRIHPMGRVQMIRPTSSSAWCCPRPGRHTTNGQLVRSRLCDYSHKLGFDLEVSIQHDSGAEG